MTPPRYLLSVDWDFFVRVLSGEWDWQHAETLLHRDVLWPIRAASLLMMNPGVEHPAEITTPQGGFVDLVGALARAGVSLRGAELTVSDSHALAMEAFAPYAPAPGMRLLHFDAHHDLGYDAATVREHDRKGVIACDDWLYWTMKGCPTLKADIIYPAWKGDEEWEHFTRPTPPWLRAGLLARVSPWVWRTGNDPIPWGDGQAVAVHVCRSGSWSPPWHDADFLRLVAALERATGSAARTLDDERGANVLKPRAFSLAEAQQHASVFREAMSQQRGKVG